MDFSAGVCRMVDMLLFCSMVVTIIGMTSVISVLHYIGCQLGTSDERFALRWIAKGVIAIVGLTSVFVQVTEHELAHAEHQRALILERKLDKHLRTPVMANEMGFTHNDSSRRPERLVSEHFVLEVSDGNRPMSAYFGQNRSSGPEDRNRHQWTGLYGRNGIDDLSYGTDVPCDPTISNSF